MQVTDAVPEPTFARHETFHLRYGWLKKAYDAALENPAIFASAEAPVRLGVGKNMVHAMRFWSSACKILEPSRGPKYPDVAPTEMGHAVFGDKDGLDPYLEDPQTLWLLQWLLFAPPCRLPAWWLVMNEFEATNVKLDELTESVVQRVTNVSEWKTPSPKSVKRDVDVFVHTYSTERGKLAMEDYLDCPFRQMRMIHQSSRDVMRFVFGRKYGMTPHITAFACLDFVDKAGLSSKSVSVTRLATEHGGVGNTFKLGENDLADMLDEACRISRLARMANVNGAQHLVFDDARGAAAEMLAAAYGRRAPRRGRRKKMEALA